MMNLTQLLVHLVTELNKANSSSVQNEPWREDNTLPIFSTSENGCTVFFTKDSLASIRKIAKIFFEGNARISEITELDNFQKIVRQEVANFYADNQFLINSDDDCNNSVKKLRDKSAGVVDELKKEFVHYFPAWTIHLMNDGPFVFGPVTIMTREQWVDAVNLPDSLLERYLNIPNENKLWKDSLLTAISAKPQPEKASGELANNFYHPIKDAPSILKVKVVGYEKDLSRKIGQLVCKTSLDAISLLLGRPDLFSTQTLQIERVLPKSIYTLVETDGNLWLPGFSLTSRFSKINYADAIDVIRKNSEIVKALGKITSSLIDTSNSNQPELCKRWATALDWYAEGCREQNSAIAVAKIGTSLDVISCGGKNVGILNMVSHLIKLNENDIIVKGDLNWSLKKLIKEIYDNGRSQILHGTHFDRLKSFEELKNIALQITKTILIECALRLNKYTGVDDDKAFRTMSD